MPDYYHFGERLLTDTIICKTVRRLRVLVLSPISSEELIEACDLLIVANVNEC